MNGMILVTLGGAFGSLCRYLLSSWVVAQTAGASFPWGTFAVNVLGCAVGGAVTAGAQYTEWLTPQWRLFLFTGILGGFTTFSAFSLETLNLLKSGQTALAFAYVLSSEAIGVAVMAIVFAANAR